MGEKQDDSASDFGDDGSDNTAAHDVPPARQPADDAPTELDATKAELEPVGAAPTDIYDVKRPRPAAVDPQDPYGGEPAWLQSGSKKRTLVGFAAIVALVALVGGIGWFFFPHGESPDTKASSKTTSKCDVSKATAAGKTAPTPKLNDPPPRQTATISTNAGDVTVLLFGDVAPCGVANFDHLAQQNYYRQSDCYRLTTQATDPTVTLRCGHHVGDGSGNPGYRFRAEQAFTNEVGMNYFALVNDDTGRAASSFAFVRGESKPTARMSVIGQIIDGFEVLDEIGGAAGLDFDDKPQPPLQILKVEVQNGTVTLPPSSSKEPSESDSPAPTRPDDGDSQQPGQSPSQSEDTMDAPDLPGFPTNG